MFVKKYWSSITQVKTPQYTTSHTPCMCGACNATHHQAEMIWDIGEDKGKGRNGNGNGGMN